MRMYLKETILVLTLTAAVACGGVSPDDTYFGDKGELDIAHNPSTTEARHNSLSANNLDTVAYSSAGGQVAPMCDGLCNAYDCPPLDCGAECAHTSGSGKAGCIANCAKANAGCLSYCKEKCRTPKLYWSNSGKIPGKLCKRFEDPDQSDPDGWDDNYLCSDVNLGLKPLAAAPLVGHRCARITETLDSDGWRDAYLCNSEWVDFQWSQSGALRDYASCLWVGEPEDTHGWSDNYLCWGK